MKHVYIFVSMQSDSCHVAAELEALCLDMALPPPSQLANGQPAPKDTAPPMLDMNFDMPPPANNTATSPSLRPPQPGTSSTGYTPMVSSSPGQGAAVCFIICFRLSVAWV